MNKQKIWNYNWYENNKPRIKQIQKAYYEKNKEQKLIYQREYYQNNKEKYIGYTSQHYKKHPEIYLESKKKIMTRLGGVFGLSKWVYNYALQCWALTIRNRDKHICQICGDKATFSHHLIYKALYPELSLNENNGISLCRNCHNEIHGRDK